MIVSKFYLSLLKNASRIADDHPAITTVGYGEITPRSFLGRLITLPLLVFGLLLIALPSFVLGREFSLVWESMTRDQVITSNLQSCLLAPFAYPTFLKNSTSDPTESPILRHRPLRSEVDRRDLSNFKLAQNQTELSHQIEDLKATVELQGKLLTRLLVALEGRPVENGRLDGHR